MSRPDTMTIFAGTVTTGATAPEAVAANASLAQRLIAAVRGSGIAARDVKTLSFNVRPSFENNRGELGPDGRPPRITGYVVTNQIQVQLRDLAGAGALIGRLFEAGANSVRGPSFSLTDDRSARRAAERAAIVEARAEAENYAAAVGKRVGRIVRIGDRRVSTPPTSSEIVMMASYAASEPTPVQPGELTTRASVYVDFALVDR